MECMGPQHKSRSSTGPSAHILRNTAKRNFKIKRAFEVKTHPNITNFPEPMGPLNKVAFL